MTNKTKPSYVLNKKALQHYRHLIEDQDGYTACSECGCTALCLLDAMYCPDCGSIIERPR